MARDDETYTLAEIREAFKKMAQSLDEGVDPQDFLMLMGLIADGMMRFDGIRDSEFTFSGTVPVRPTTKKGDLPS